MPAHQGKKHSLRGAIVGLLKRTPVRKRQVGVEKHTSNAQTTCPAPDETHGLEQYPRPENDEPKHDDPQPDSDEQPPCPKDDEVEDDTSRGRSSAFTPTREREPTPQPSASKPRSPKTVQWAIQLEESTPQKKEPPIPKRDKMAESERGCDTEEKNQDAEKPRKEELISKEEPHPEPRRQQCSNIPLQKSRLSTSSASTSYLPRPRSQAMIKARASTNPIRQASERPPSSLHIPKDKDSLCLDKTKTIPSSNQVPEDGKHEAKGQLFTANSSRKREPSKPESETKPQPTVEKTAQYLQRNFSYPIRTVTRSAARQHDQSSITKEKPMPAPTTSFLKAIPRRFTSSASAKSNPAPADDNPASIKASIPSPVTTTSLPPEKEPGCSEASSAPTNPSSFPSASAPSFESAKTFWSKIESDTVNGNRSVPVSVPCSKPNEASSKRITAPKTSQIPKTSFNATKTFWAQLEMSDGSGSISVDSRLPSQASSQHTPKRKSQQRRHFIDIDSSPFISTPASNL